MEFEKEIMDILEAVKIILLVTIIFLILGKEGSE
jgi:uncharacterized membrane protein